MTKIQAQILELYTQVAMWLCLDNTYLRFYGDKCVLGNNFNSYIIASGSCEDVWSYLHGRSKDANQL